MKDTAAIEGIIDIIKKYDIIAIQEVRDKSEKSIHYLLKLLNESVANGEGVDKVKSSDEKKEEVYKLALSARTGDTSASEEQYAVFYKHKRVQVRNDET